MDMFSTTASYNVCDIEVVHISILIALPCVANHTALELKFGRDANLENGVMALTETGRLKHIDINPIEVAAAVAGKSPKEKNRTKSGKVL
jgi:hypothetical protein